jgi:hypothetical protein
MYGITRTCDKYMELFTEPTTTSRQENKQLLGGGPGTMPRRIWVAKTNLWWVCWEEIAMMLGLKRYYLADGLISRISTSGIFAWIYNTLPKVVLALRDAVATPLRLRGAVRFMCPCGYAGLFETMFFRHWTAH